MVTHDKLLNVPARNKFLNLEILADKKQYKPREAAQYTVLARNSDGSPAAGAELSFGLVDEAIYSVKPDQTRDIRKAFYGRRYNQVRTNFSVSFSFSGYSGDKRVRLASNKPNYQLADFKNEGQYAEPMIRKDFKDTAFWQPDLVTGADGKAAVNVTLPDNLTTWRATARAVTSDTKVGSAISKVVARKDLILRLEMPRFLTEGDTVTLSAIVHNYMDSDKATRISIEATGGNLLDQREHMVTIAKQGEQRIDWRVAAPTVGSVKLLAKALTDKESDAVEMILPVVPQGLKRTKGEAVNIADENSEKTISLDAPADANSAARALRIEAAPSITGTLFGALDYLTSYPYGCTEQTMSGFLPNVIVAQVLKEVKTTTVRPTNDLAAKVERGLDRLYGFQHSDGGWGWWKDDKTDSFMTAYVVDGLTLAKRAGYNVDAGRIERGRNKLRILLDLGKTESGVADDPETRAYMIYAWIESGEGTTRHLEEAFDSRSSLRPYSRALLALALKLRNDPRARQVAGEIESSASTTDLDAHWESERQSHWGYVYDESIEGTALSLKALARITPRSPLLAKAARWLVGNRRHGYYWDSTKHTAFAIYGLTDYLKVSKELSADYSVEVYLNGEQVLNRKVSESDASSGQAFVVERKAGQAPGSNQLRIVKHGRGVLYVSAALDYFTRGDQVAAEGSQNLTLTREYMRLAVKESGGQASWSIEPLAGELRSGDLIVCRLRVKGAKAAYMMIEDPIPAGCEQVERVSGIDLDYNQGRWSDWYK